MVTVLLTLIVINNINMKNSVFLLVVLIFSSIGNAQEIIMKKGSTVNELKKGAYYKLPELDKFEGTWVSKNNGEVFELVISNEKTFLERIGIYRDYLQGNYYYSEIDCCKRKEGFTIQNGSLVTSEDNIVSFFSFEDILRNKRGRVTFELLPDGKTAKWTLTNSREGLIIGEYDRSFSVPMEIILTKVE